MRGRFGLLRRVAVIAAGAESDARRHVCGKSVYTAGSHCIGFAVMVRLLETPDRGA
jgi:hypothetical protein